VVEAGATHRSIQSTAIGNFMEAYDFTLFSLVATILAQKFYPGENSGTGNLIATFGTMTAGFVVRPLGGFIFGPLGDRIGRKPVGHDDLADGAHDSGLPATGPAGL